MKTIVKTTQIKKHFGGKGNHFTALNGIDLTIMQGEFVAIMGPSGSGKTTLLNILATIDHTSSGSVTIADTDVSSMSERQLASFRQKQLGFIFQDFNLLNTLTVRENIVLPLAFAKTAVAEIDRRVEKIADQLGIQPILEKYPYDISGGEKQRTAAARAMISEPSLILADEPTGALDSRSATNLLESLQRLNLVEQATILMVTHDAFAASYCERVLFIKDGTIFCEIGKGEQSRKQFFTKILDVLTVLGGDTHVSI